MTGNIGEESATCLYYFLREFKASTVIKYISKKVNSYIIYRPVNQMGMLHVKVLYYF